MSSYWRSIVTVALSCMVSEIKLGIGTGSVTVVTDCQKCSYYLPVSYQIDIRTVKFLHKFQSSDNTSVIYFRRKHKLAWRIFSHNMEVISTMSITWQISLRTLSSVMTRNVLAVFSMYFIGVSGLRVLPLLINWIELNWTSRPSMSCDMISWSKLR